MAALCKQYQKTIKNLNDDVKALDDRVKRREERIKKLEAKSRISSTILQSYINSEAISSRPRQGSKEVYRETGTSIERLK